MISVLIPWRTDNGWRQKIFDWTLPRWQQTGWEVIIGEPDDGPWNISVALNRARSKATGKWLVVMGADHIPDPGRINRCVQNLMRRKIMWTPIYRARQILTQESTEEILAGADPNGRWPVQNIIRGCPGLMAINSIAWDTVHGYDERFFGWGGEDTSMRRALATFYPRQAHHGVGIVTDFWHPPASRELFPENQSIAQEYIAAFRNPDAMKEIIAGR